VGFGICGGQSGAGAGSLRVLRFPLPIFIPPIAPQSPLYIIWGWYNRAVVAAVPSGLSLTPQIIIIIIIRYRLAALLAFSTHVLLTGVFLPRKRRACKKFV
jgi:hypothetical protein